MLKRHLRYRQTSSEANRLREKAKSMAPSSERDRLMRKARQLDMAARIDGCLNSPGLQPPKHEYPIPNAHRRGAALFT